MHLLCDVTRLVFHYRIGLRPTGIDKVNLAYAKWTLAQSGSLGLRQGRKLKRVSAAKAEILLATLSDAGPGQTQEGNGEKKRLPKLATLGLLAVSGTLHPTVQFALEHFDPWRFLTKFSNGEDIPSGAIILNTSHAWLASKQVWSWLLERENRVVPFIHDLIPIEYPEYSSSDDGYEKHTRRINNALRYARGVIVNSQATQASLREYAGKIAFSVPPLQVALVGHDRKEAPPGEAFPKIEAPYFLILGTIEPRKNHLFILTHWKDLARRLGKDTPKLVIVGRRGWKCEKVVDLLERCQSLLPHVIELNTASDERVVHLLRGARALLFPSFAEGFGMPLQEALAMGTPVIASPLPVFQEIAGNIPDYAEPYDGVRWLDLITDYARPDSHTRAKQIMRLQAFRETTWGEHFRKVEAFLVSLR